MNIKLYGGKKAAKSTSRKLLQPSSGFVVFNLLDLACVPKENHAFNMRENSIIICWKLWKMRVNKEKQNSLNDTFAYLQMVKRTSG